MTKDEIKNIKKARYKLREKITKCIDKDIKTNEVKAMVLEYHDLTKQLADAGCNVSIKLDYLKLDYWDNISNIIPLPQTQHIAVNFVTYSAFAKIVAEILNGSPLKSQSRPAQITRTPS